MSTWHYQPVWREEPADTRTYSICEVYLDAEGRLERWTTNCEIWPGGHTHEELQRDIGQMYEDCWRWEPVAFEALTPGMVLAERKIR